MFVFDCKESKTYFKQNVEKRIVFKKTFFQIQ